MKLTWKLVGNVSWLSFFDANCWTNKCGAMFTLPHNLDVVLRFSEVSLSREAFEAILTLSLDRYEHSRVGIGHYAQINLPPESSWDSVKDIVTWIGPLIQPLITVAMARPCVDAALYLDVGIAASSMLIPSAVALALGNWGFDLEVSVYVSSPE